MKILFVCTANKPRSPAAATIFPQNPNLDVRSAGLDDDCPRPMTPELVVCADRISVMERRHRDKIKRRFRRVLDGKEITVLGIPDEYEYMQPELVRLLEVRVGRYLGGN